ncbi:MAG: hypothetical protein ACK5ME_12340 [Parahaliea sp.]
MKKLFLTMISVFAFSANAAMVDFNTHSAVYWVDDIIEGDYIFSRTHQGMGVNNAALWPSDGSMHLMTWSNQGDYSGFMLTNPAETYFDITSFDFAGAYNDGRQPVTSLMVSGWRDGQTVDTLTFNAGVDFLNASAYRTVNINFSAIDALEVVAFGANNRASFDNFDLRLVATALPEAVGLGLFAFGLVSLGLHRRKNLH